MKNIFKQCYHKKASWQFSKCLCFRTMKVTGGADLRYGEQFSKKLIKLCINRLNCKR